MTDTQTTILFDESHTWGWQSIELEGAWIFWSIYGTSFQPWITDSWIFMCTIKFYMLKSLLIWGFCYIQTNPKPISFPQYEAWKVICPRLGWEGGELTQVLYQSPYFNHRLSSNSFKLLYLRTRYTYMSQFENWIWLLSHLKII